MHLNITLVGIKGLWVGALNKCDNTVFILFLPMFSSTRLIVTSRRELNDEM